MSGPREGHAEAIDYARQQIEAAMQLMGAFKEAVEAAMIATINAVGDTPNQNGQDAKSFIAEVQQNRVDEIIRILDNAFSKLGLYGQGV